MGGWAQLPEPLLISIFNQLPASEVAPVTFPQIPQAFAEGPSLLLSNSNPIKFLRHWLAGKFAPSGCRRLEMDLFGNDFSAETSLSSSHPQGGTLIILLNSFQRLREGALGWLDEYRRLVDETPTVVASVLHGHTDEVGKTGIRINRVIFL